jgi:hypothetical protein
MQEMPPVDRAELDADRERLESLPDDKACPLPVGRIRGYLNALAVVLPPPDEQPTRHEAEPRPQAVLRASEALEKAGVRLRPPDPAAFEALGPSRSSRRWAFRRLARLPSWRTIGFIVLGGALVLGTSAWRDDVAKAVGETVVFALVGARAFGTVVDRAVRKGGGPEEVGEDVVDEPGALVGFVLLVATYVAAAAAVREGAALAGVSVSWIGAGLFGLLVTLSLALEYGVVSADRLALK